MISASIEWANHPGGIAIVGMAGRFPGAEDVEAFWRNLRSGVESIRFFSEAELRAAGIDEKRFKDPSYLPASGFLPGIEEFDAAFFGFTPREAQITDPQQRLFLECAWTALESAGYDPKRYSGLIGVYAGCGATEYIWRNVYPHRGALEGIDDFQLFVSSDKDFLSTRVSYKLDLHGPSLTIQTACSTSLVTVCVACQALLTFQCDMALAGGVSVDLRGRYGRLYREGLPFSPDGHCRAFDASAQGTVGGDGVGVVVLKRLEDAIAKGDHIYAVIKGAGLNNDGSSKIGYTAPSIAGQAQAVAQALAVADMPPSTVQYIEAHGTGTPLGDPIEIAALTEVFRGVPRGACAIGSVKTNIGHLNSAAGIASLIKTVQALRYGEIPPSLHFQTPNPKLDLPSGPFHVNTQLVPWVAKGVTARRAGVSSFGIGGTNAHVVLEEAPPQGPSLPSRPWHLLTLSARTDSALAAATQNLEQALEKGAAHELSDIAYTLHTGRRAFPQRCFAVCRDHAGAGASLRAVLEQRAFSQASSSDRELAFLFPGGGAQYPDMGRELYQSVPHYREEIDRCAQMLQPHLGLDIRKEMYPAPHARATAAERLRHIALSLTSVFVTEYALAQLLRSWGLVPRQLIGHSLGEYTAACLAGVFSLEDALRLVAARGRLMAHAPSGAMLSLPLSEAELLPLLGDQLSIAANNGPQSSVVSGPLAQIEALEEICKARAIDARRLHLSMGAHSVLVEPILAQFTQEVAALRLRPPQIPFISNVSGTWIREDEATSPAYWARHLRKTVRFADGLQILLQDPQRILLEVGPGQTLRSLAAQHPSRQQKQLLLCAMRPPTAAVSDVAFLLEAVGKIWVAGGSIDWEGFHRSEKRRRVPLPTYPFERQRFWLEAPREANPSREDPAPHPVASEPIKATVIDGATAAANDRFYQPVFRRQELAVAEKPTPATWLILMDDASAESATQRSVGAAATRLLTQRGERVVRVYTGENFSCPQPGTYTVSPRQRADYERLLDDLRRQGMVPDRILHLWNLMPVRATDDAHAQLDRSFYSLLALTQALAAGGSLSSVKTALTVATRGLFRVDAEPLSRPIQAAALGACLVLPKEYELLRCLCVDLAGAADSIADSIDDQTLAGLLAEGSAAHTDSIIAYRNAQRFVRTFEKVELPQPTTAPPSLRPQGVYLITGGLGGIGLELAEHLAHSVQARLVLIGRSAPNRELAQRLRTLEAASGAVVMHATADVADRVALQAVVRAALSRFGRIDGVIHAAGVAGGGAVHNRRLEASAAVLRAKVHGTIALDEVLKDVLRDAPPDFVVLCSSLNAILGVFGQADYTAANAFLDAFAQHKQGAAPRYLSINWDAWRDIGMAGRATSTATAQPAVPPTPAVAPAPKTHPLLASRTQSAAGEIEFHATFLPQDFWPLNEHRLVDQPTLPSTAYLDAAIAAILASGVQKGTPIELHKVVLKGLLSVAEGQRVRVSTVLDVREGAREWEFSVRSQAEGETAREHCRGGIVAHPSSAKRPPHRDLASLTAGCAAGPVAAAFAESVLRPAQRWRCLRRVWRGEGEGIAELVLDAELAAELKVHPLHPGLLDVALGFIGAWLPAAYLPCGYERVRVFAPLERQLTSQVYYALPAGAAPDTLAIDATIRDLSGVPLVEVVGLALRRLNVRSR